VVEEVAKDARGLEAGRVLVVDDEPPLGRALKRMLDREHEVQVAHSAVDALELFRAGSRFDVVLCDVTMPGMSGVDLHDRLRIEQPECAASFVFMTGGVCEPSLLARLEGLPNARLDKPLDIHQVRLAIAATIRSVRS
jgi:CheY-like chemotaxis protein